MRTETCPFTSVSCVTTATTMTITLGEAVVRMAATTSAAYALPALCPSVFYNSTGLADHWFSFMPCGNGLLTIDTCDFPQPAMCVIESRARTRASSNAFPRAESLLIQHAWWVRPATGQHTRASQPPDEAPG